MKTQANTKREEKKAIKVLEAKRLMEEKKALKAIKVLEAKRVMEEKKALKTLKVLEAKRVMEEKKAFKAKAAEINRKAYIKKVENMTEKEYVDLDDSDKKNFEEIIDEEIEQEKIKGEDKKAFEGEDLKILREEIAQRVKRRARLRKK